MGKLLFWLLIGLLIYILWRGAKRRSERRAEDQRASAPEIEQMVRCEVCQVNLPRSEAILSHGRFYCCEAHRRDGAV
jgi:uncharacterized protein